MILSFHPCFVGDRNIICAGREPDDDDLAAIEKADAVVLPQGCARSLHEMAVHHCARVFPDYRVRFDHPGKIGQDRLFKALRVAHPASIAFSGMADLATRHPGWRDSPPIDLPMVFKFNWGGEGESVFLVETPGEYTNLMQRVAEQESSGYAGFLFQEYVPSGNRTLRVAVVGSHMVAYWRVQDDPERFHANLLSGGRIDAASDRHLRERGISAVRSFCGQTGINLAGFDLLFPDETDPSPLFLEINWFFGRRGLGGSENFYTLLTGEIACWLETIG